MSSLRAEPNLPASTSAAASWRATLQEAHSCPGHNRQRAAVSSAKTAKVRPMRNACRHRPVQALWCLLASSLVTDSACRDVPAKAGNSSTEDAEADNSNLKVGASWNC